MQGTPAVAAEAATEFKFTVADTGCGIDADVLPRLFQAFEQADQSNARQFGGTGLGLAVSRRLADLMGGRITVQSRLGEGSAFTVCLPAALCAGPMAEQTAADGLGAPVEGQRPVLRVLVAEDNDANRKIVEAFLTPLEASITFARNGIEAVDALSKQRFDVVLMDVQMPLMDGVEATRQLRASTWPSAGAPVIALTANVMDVQCAAYLAAGMDAHVAKPIEPGRLLATIADLVNIERATAGPAADRALGA